MGYTHYWKYNDNSVKDEIKKSVIEKVKKAIDNAEKSGVVVADGMGEVRDDYTVDNNFILFNGFEDESHETFQFDWKQTDFDFCKTNRKEYDGLVVACLIILDSELKDFHWKSDGDEENDFMDEAFELLEITDEEFINNYKNKKIKVE